MAFRIKVVPPLPESFRLTSAPPSAHPDESLGVSQDEPKPNPSDSSGRRA